MELKFHNDMSFILNVLCLFACHVVSYRKGGGSSVRASVPAMVAEQQSR